MSKKIIFSSGGTGGHILPTINLMKHFSEKGYEVVLITDKKGTSFLKDYSNFKSYITTTESFTNKKFFKSFYSFLKIFYAVIESVFILKKEKADMIIGFGGYVSFPICFVSRFFNLPLIIYENNMILGRTNKFLLSSVKRLFVAIEKPLNLPSKYENKVQKVGPILNKKIINYSFKNKIDNKNFSILVLGGSQGAEVFGKVIPQAIKMLNKKGFNINIIQQCVKNQKKELIEFYKENEIKNDIFEFNEDILNKISSADLAISRCGASTTAELVHTCTPFIAIPYKYSLDNHQFFNAKYYKDKNYCWLMEEKNFNSVSLCQLILEIISDKKKLENVRKIMKKNYSNDVYNNIENIINKIIKNEN